MSMAITAMRALRMCKRCMDTAMMRKHGSTKTISRQVCVTSIKILRSGVRRKFHAPVRHEALYCNGINPSSARGG